MRNHENIARIEIDSKDFEKVIRKRKEVLKKFKKLGFDYVTLDLEGYRTGSMNEGMLNGKK